MYQHDSHSALYRSPLGPVAAGSSVTLRIRADEARAVLLRVWDGEEDFYDMFQVEEGLWETKADILSHPGLAWYDFIIQPQEGHAIRYGAPDDGLGGEGDLYQHGLHSYQLTVYDPKYRTPEWMHGASIYQIFPDRFRKAPTESVDRRTNRRMHKEWEEDFFPNKQGENGSMDFWGGTLNGIREKLPYIHSLGVTVIYLNPVFESHCNHRYDTADYTRVDPLLGTNEELEALFREAEALGMRVILDGVFSHTGSDSLYFNAAGNYPTVGAAQSVESPYYPWYTFEHWPDKYRCWWGVTSMPELRKDNRDYQHFMFNQESGIVPRWLKAGAAGWRLDVADELTMDFLRKLRRSAKRVSRNALVLGEVWEDASNKVAYDEMRCYCCGDTLDSVMNYPLRTAILDFITGESDAYDFVRLVEHQREVYPAPFRYALMNLVGSHDRARALNVLVGREGKDLSKADQAKLRLTPDEYALAVKRYKLCVDLLCALPGCPTIYYGDEAGLIGPPDPYNRKPFPWGHEDQELQKYVSARLSHHRESEVLQRGWCEISAPDADTVRIERFLEGDTDALGQRTHARGREVFTIRR
ncbi:MAG: glycoside hydrolase family 13 protein [Clostridia bacterium]|nr:glycoside hydrolase family 13 protein [Clostridia bacterium]